MREKIRGRPRPQKQESPPEAESLEAQAELVEITKSTMAGDLIAATLDELKAAPTVWQKMSEKQQQEVIDRVTNRVVHNVTQAVALIAAEARPAIRAKLAAVTIKDDLKATVLMSRHHAQRHEFIDSSGQEILIVLLNAEQFTGGAGDIKADPDQAQLALQGSEMPDDEPAGEDADEGGSGEPDDNDDEMLPQAVKFVISTQKTSISALQAGLRVGYNRAARLLETMEERGVVSSRDANGLRTVIVSES